MDGVGVYRQAVLQSVLRHCVESAWFVRVGEVARRQPAFRTRKEIVAYTVEVSDARIAEVDVAEITPTDPIPWAKRFPEA
jgi:hypothetical protein